MIVLKINLNDDIIHSVQMIVALITMLGNTDAQIRARAYVQRERNVCPCVHLLACHSLPGPVPEFFLNFVNMQKNYIINILDYEGHDP